MRSRPVELRSDTFTRPTEAMRRAMYEAEVGDDVWGEDPTVKRLEERAADLLGKEAALFVPSGTQGNLIGLLSHTQSGDEVVLGDQTHIFLAEVAGAAVIGGLQFRTLPNRDRGRLEPEEVSAAIRPPDDHYPRTGCIALENTHNNCGGSALTPDEMQSVADVAHAAGIPVHLDGARVFNAAVALGLPAAELVAPADSVMFCLSKGLGAPVGSILTGSHDYIRRAHRWRKRLGGGMRQVGVLAAAGLIALEDNRDRLAEDHANARLLAEGLASIPGLAVDPQRVETNMVFFDVDGIGLHYAHFLELLASRGVLMAWAGRAIRAVTSYEVSRSDIEHAVQVVASVVREAAPALA